jgi:hypothetical protein
VVKADAALGEAREIAERWLLFLPVSHHIMYDRAAGFFYATVVDNMYGKSLY